VWRLLLDAETGKPNASTAETPSTEQLRWLHRTIAKVTEDIESLRFNTAIAALMELTNAAYKWEAVPNTVAEHLILLLAPFAPHFAEELWARLGHGDSLAYAPWPTLDERYLKADTLEIAVQVNGKVRGRLTIPAAANEAQVLELARNDENVSRHLSGKSLRRAIYVPGRIINFVIGN
jgi:leucyl-tRNA synthetase